MSMRARILAVDDHAANLAVMREILGEEYELRCASSGEEAIEIVRAFGPDLVLLDIMMPGMDGYEACRRLREDQRTRYAKIILVSAKTSVSERLKGYEVGADDYVTKPFEPEELAAKVKVFLRLKFMEEMDRFKSDILTLLAHETRTPVTVIASTLDILRSAQNLNDNKRNELIDNAVSSCGRLSSLMERSNLLCLLRAGQAELKVESVSVRAAFEAIRQLLSAVANNRQIGVRINVPEDTRIQADPNMFRIVVHSLLHNAIRFSPSPGEVAVEAKREGAGVSIVVTDHGPGIDSSYLSQVFEEFIPRDIVHHGGGQGLSLALSREIIRQHGGEVEVHSEPHKGTNFVIRWPASSNDTVRVTTAFPA